MADWPLCDGAGATDVGTSAGTTVATSAVPNALANTYGAWAQLVASTPFLVSGFWLFLRPTVVFYNNAVNIGVGGAGSEQIVLGNLPVAGSGVRNMVWVPLVIPQGVRLAVQMISNQTAGGGAPNIETNAILCANGFAPAQAFGATDQYGYTNSPPSGVAVDPGGVANTKGAWTQIVASTTRPASALMIELWPPDSAAPCRYMIDIGVGGAGSEQIVVTDAFSSNTITNNQHDFPVLGPFPCNIPAGTALSARCQSNTAGLGTRNTKISLRTFS